MFKRFFADQKIHIDRRSNVSVRSNRESSRQRVANTELIQLFGGLYRSVAHTRCDEPKHLFDVHMIYSTPRDLSIRKFHDQPLATSTARLSMGGALVAVAYASIERVAIFDTE